MAEEQDDTFTDRLRPTINACMRGELAPNVTLMRLLIEATTPDEIGFALEAASGAHDGNQIAEVTALWQRSQGAWALIKSILNEADHRPTATPIGPGHWAEIFDRLADISPEAGVALYSLGSAALLDAATASIVDRLREWNLVGSDRVVLDMGCGIGRIAAAVASKVRCVVATDISPRMLAIARRRCAPHKNVLLVQTSGRDLAALADAAFDLVLAVDTFPYLVLTGDGLVERHLHETNRVLKPGGSLVLFNYAYGEHGEAPLLSLAAEAGLNPVRIGTRDLACWDGMTYHLRRVG